MLWQPAWLLQQGLVQLVPAISNPAWQALCAMLRVQRMS
jgi:hypothetical protein